VGAVPKGGRTKDTPDDIQNARNLENGYLRPDMDDNLAID
jgi:hypothetical protein